MVPHPQPAALVSEELIDDRALRAVGDDAFHLADFAAELVALCGKTTLPANVVLFGPWGSGKSSLANLLEDAFKAQTKIGFARFDAFKYAEVPLRRHFLSQIAKAFKVKDKKYSQELYSTTKTNKHRIPPRDLFGFLVLVASVTGVVLLLLGLVAVLVAAVSKGPFGSSFTSALRAGIPGVIIGSGLLSAFAAVAGQTFTVESTQEAPSTEEEFERLFRDLVVDIKKKGFDRIVIFIDELDRCSPGQVVTVLETIKTFLDIPPCVFVVAADQQAVEHALTEEARQTTPADPANPYYSAGSAYLDKIFQYQLALPPLLPRTLSQFALNLIDKRPGVWTEITNKPELITVLVPGHVRSPRRVKVLLNSFVLAYRLALRRSSEGALDSGIPARASEMAKLVCLRTEFPLFAADLRIDARIPQATLALSRNGELRLKDLNLPGFSEEAFARSEAYARGLLPLDEVIARRPETTTESATRDTEEEASDEAADGEVAEPAAGNATKDTDDVRPPALTDPSDIIKSQARQLIAYLQRTEAIAGPARDLVFLESSGAALGLNAELADELERNALNGATDAVSTSIAGLEPTEQEAAYHLLCHLVRETFGLEADNARHCLLEAVQASKADLSSVVDDVLTTLRASTDGYDLRRGDLPGAFELSLLRNSPLAAELRKEVLEREETRTDEKLGLLLLSRSAMLNVDERSLLGPVLAARVISTEPELLFDALAGLDDSLVADLIDPQEEEIRDALDPEEAPAHLGQLAEHAVSQRVGLAPLLIRLLLDLDTQTARTTAEPLLTRIEPITDEALIKAVLSSTAYRVLSLWDRWLKPLDPKSVSSLDEAPLLIGTLAARALTFRFSTENPATDDEASNAIELLAQLWPHEATITSEQVEAAFAALAPGPVVADADGDARAVLHRLTHLLADDKLLPQEVGARLILNDVNGSLAQPITITTGTEQLPHYVVSGVNLAIEQAVATDVEATVSAAAASPWLVPPYKNLITLYGRAVQRVTDEAVAVPLEAAEIAALLSIGIPAEPAISAWIRFFRPAPEVVGEVFRQYSTQRDLAQSLRDAIRALAGDWTEDQRRSYFGDLAGAFVSGEAGLSLVSAAGFDAIQPTFMAAELARLFDDANNNTDRERVVQLWSTVGPTANDARRTLIDRVYIPLLRQGKGAAKIALDYFDLVRDPPSTATRDRMRAAINDEVKGDEALKRRANDLMRDAGWIRRGRLATSRQVVYEAERVTLA